MPKYNAHKDTVQTPIVKALRQVGAFVAVTHTLGGGFPDIVVGYDNVWTPLELKTPGGTLTPEEELFWLRARRAGCDIQLAYSTEDAIRIPRRGVV